MALIAALAAVALHVANYNFTAQVEHRTRVFTKLIGRNAVYIYAAYLVASAALRDKVIEVLTPKKEKTRAPLVVLIEWQNVSFCNILCMCA